MNQSEQTPDQDFDLQKYLVPKNQNSYPSSVNSLENQEPVDLDKYRVKSTGEKFGRHAARIGSRIAETAVGLPGDIYNFVKFLGENIPTPEFLKSEPNIIQKAGKSLLEKLPTSSDLKEFSSHITKGFTDPQGAAEELGDEITSLATSLMIPSKDPTKFMNLLKSVGLATAATGARKGAEVLGAGQLGQTAAQFGTLFLTGLIGKKTADKFVSEQFQQARSKIPEGTMIPTSGLISGLESVEKELLKGISTSTKNEVLSSVKELKNKASGGAMPAQDLVESYHNINERLNAKKLFDELSKPERKNLKNRYDLFKTQVGKSIKEYGSHNPDFYNQWKNANEAYATIQQSKNVSNFLQSHLKYIPNHLVGTVVMELLLGYPKAAAATTGAAGAVKAGELLFRIGKSPTLRKHYLNILDSSMKENLPATIKHLNLFDKEYSKES